jgi:TonB family protein
MEMFRYARLTAMLVAALDPAAGVATSPGFTPARYVGGSLPAPPALTVSGGEVFLEVLVAEDGRVDSVRTLRTTPPFTDAVITAVRGWRFIPAAEPVAPSTGQTEGATRSVAGPVFVAAMFVPPALNGPTLGQPPQDVASPSGETPTPMVATPATYPPNAAGDGVVLVEVTIDASGSTDAHVIVSSPAFDEAASAAARSWSFSGARRDGNGVPAHAYLLFSFRSPVIR